MEDRACILMKFREGSNSKSYKDLPQELKQDREIALAAVSMGGGMYAHVPPELKCDREIALAAVKNAGGMLAKVPVELRGDREIVERAVENNSSMLKHASAELKANRDFILSLLPRANNVKDVVRCAAPEVQKDRGVAEVAVKYDRIGGDVVNVVHRSLRDDKAFLLAAVRSNPHSFITAARRSVKLLKDTDLIQAYNEATERMHLAIMKLPDFDRLMHVRDEQLDDTCLQLLRAHQLQPDRIRWQLDRYRDKFGPDSVLIQSSVDSSRQQYDELRQEGSGKIYRSLPLGRSASRSRSPRGAN